MVVTKAGGVGTSAVRYAYDRSLRMNGGADQAASARGVMPGTGGKISAAGGGTAPVPAINEATANLDSWTPSKVERRSGRRGVSPKG